VSDLQHPLSRSFEDIAELYERTRPSYPPAVVDWLAEQLGIDATATVLDLGAGTGKLTRALIQRGAHVIAVEPGPEMLAQLQRVVPEAEAILGSAEEIPLPTDAVDVVVCGQSFHWFRIDEALPEIRRVLRTGGGLGLIWNLRHPDDPLQNEITELLGPLAPSGHAHEQSYAAAFVHEALNDVTSHVVSFEEELDADAVVERIASISFVAAASEARRRDLELELRALVAARGGRAAFRYVTEAYVTFAV